MFYTSNHPFVGTCAETMAVLYCKMRKKEIFFPNGENFFFLLRYKGEGVMTMAEIGASSYRRFLQEETILDQILIAYSDSLVRFAYSMVHSSAAAEDIAAESIAVLLTKHKHFRDEAHLRAYLYQIAHHKAVDYLRLHSKHVPLEDVENVLGGGDLEEGMLQKERNEAIYRSMQALPAQYRQVLQLAYFDGFDVQSICKITKKTPKQVYNLLFRSKASLKELLEKEGITHEDL